MKRFIILICCAAAPLVMSGQQAKLNLDQLQAKASEHLDLNLNATTLQFAAKFLDADDPEEAQIKKMVSGLEGIWVRHFVFKASNSWTQADLEAIRAQLRGPEWTKIVGVKSEDEDETDEVYMRTVGNKMAGVAILAASGKELTVVQISGPIDLDALATLGGHMGVPKFKLPAQKPK